jgi:outer membrane protein
MNASRRAPGTRYVLALAGLAAGLAGGLTGCSSSPLADQRERDLRRTVVDSIRTELDDAQLRPGARAISRQPEALPIDPKFYPELEAMAGPGSRDFTAVEYGPDLMGVEARPVGISLERAIRSAVANNLEVQFARLAPAISEADVVAAEAAFDWTLFSNLNWNDLDQVSPSSSFGSNAGLNQRQSVQGQTGVRRQLESGGQFAVQQELIYTDFETRGQTFTPDPATQATMSFQFDQPLLRGFGSDVALAQVRVNRNVERDAVARLRVQLLQTVNQTEGTYWELVRAQHDLAILQKLLERGLKTRDQLQTRLDAGLDVPPSQLADAVARVERRKSDVRQARDAVRDAGDRIKVLMNDPDFPVGSEVMLLPLDQGVDEPMAFSLVDALTTAVTRRPEVDQAIVSMDNTSIRETVAANQRLPQLNLQIQTRFQGMDDALGAVSSEFDGNFVDYVVGLAFEQAIGNRGPEAEYTRRRLEREQAVISYRNTVQQIVRDVKASLRAVTSNYEIVAQRRQARIAAGRVAPDAGGREREDPRPLERAAGAGVQPAGGPRQRGADGDAGDQRVQLVGGAAVRGDGHGAGAQQHHAGGPHRRRGAAAPAQRGLVRVVDERAHGEPRELAGGAACGRAGRRDFGARQPRAGAGRGGACPRRLRPRRRRPLKLRRGARLRPGPRARTTPGASTPRGGEACTRALRTSPSRSRCCAAAGWSRSPPRLSTAWGPRRSTPSRLRRCSRRRAGRRRTR